MAVCAPNRLMPLANQRQQSVLRWHSAGLINQVVRGNNKAFLEFSQHGHESDSDQGPGPVSRGGGDQDRDLVCEWRGSQESTGMPQAIQITYIRQAEWSANPSLTVRMMRPESGHQAAGLGVGIVWYVCDNSSSYMKCTIQLSYMSVWPSGLRRQLQVLFFFGRRGFEPLSGQATLFFCLYSPHNATSDSSGPCANAFCQPEGQPEGFSCV